MIAIVPIRSTYRGTDRALALDDFLSNTFYEIMPYYEQSIALEVSELTQAVLEDTITCYVALKNYMANLEVIVFDAQPICEVFGKRLELLGIDVTNELTESLLESPPAIVCNILNEHGLCRCIEDIDFVLKHSDCGNIMWEPCWVYRLLDLP